MTTQPNTPPVHHDILILGAGISGLACASRLLRSPKFQQNKGSLLVLEARDRIGGRIGSVHVQGCRLDTGANWIHGIGTKERPNPLMDILPHKRYRALSRSVAFKRPDGDAVAVGAEAEIEGGWTEVSADGSAEESAKQGNGDLVVPADVSGMMMGSLFAAIGELRELASETSGEEAKRTSMLQAIIRSEGFREAYEMVPEELKATFGCMPQFVEGMEAAPLVPQSSERLEDQKGVVSLLEFALDEFEGEQVFLQDGYTAVVEEVAKDLVKDDLIRLNTQVTKINWDRSPIEIQTSNGTYTAQQVICTLSLGVLQHDQRHNATTQPLFQPALPQDKREAISSLGYGTLDKIFLIYDNPWWTTEPFASIIRKGLMKRPSFPSPSAATTPNNSSNELDSNSPDNLMLFTHELGGLEIHLPTGAVSPGPRALFIINLQNLTGYPVLSAFVSCANATHIEALPDAEAAALVHRALTTGFGVEPPKRKAVHVTRWARDPWARGSYSHMLTDVTEVRHREIFTEPVKGNGGGTLRFAGEHTSRDHFATVHGALLSGWREADGILNGMEGKEK